MEGGCQKNVTLEERIYWTHFRTIHFFQFLTADFEDQLDIPEKFTHNLNHKLPATVTLRGPSGVSWNVGLVTSDDTLAFKHGWKQFVHDNSLVENDFLMFKYDGKSQFDVLMFDSRSLCEKEATYFVKEHGHTKQVGECQTDGRKKETCSEIILTSPNGFGCSSFELTNVDDDDDFTTPSEKNISFQSTKTNSRRKAECKSLPTRRSSRIRRPTSSAMVLHKYDDMDVEWSIPKGRVYAKQYISNRRPVTEDEKMRAILAARAAKNNGSVIIIMRPTSVYKKFFVVIPKEWLIKHVHLENQDVIVRNGNRTWHTRLYYIKARGYGGLSGGWRKFTVDNNLEEFDVCLFQIAPGSNSPIVLDISIFRVVDDITPLTGVFRNRRT